MAENHSKLSRFFMIQFSWSKNVIRETGQHLTHHPLDKMAAILADDNFKCISLNENYRIPIYISLKFFPKGPIDNKPALVQVMAWRRTGDKPLPELMLTVYWRIYATLGGDELSKWFMDVSLSLSVALAIAWQNSTVLSNHCKISKSLQKKHDFYTN